MKTPEQDLQGFTSVCTVHYSLVMETLIGLVGWVRKDLLSYVVVHEISYSSSEGSLCHTAKGLLCLKNKQTNKKTPKHPKIKPTFESDVMIFLVKCSFLFREPFEFKFKWVWLTRVSNICVWNWARLQERSCSLPSLLQTFSGEEPRINNLFLELGDRN